MAIRTLSDAERREFEAKARLLLEVCARSPESDWMDLLEEVANAVLTLSRGTIYFPARPPRSQPVDLNDNQTMGIGA